MLNKLKIMVAAAALSGTMSANAYAATVKVQPGDSLWSLSQVHKASVDDLKEWNELANENIHPGDVLTVTAPEIQDQDSTVWNQAKTLNSSFIHAQKWDKNIAAFMHPEDLINHYNEKKTDVKQGVEKIQPVAVIARPVSKPVNAAPKAKTIAVPKPKQAAVSAPKPAAKRKAIDNPKEMIVKATAYTASCEGCSGITATGVNIKENPDERVIAVDPNVIPLGSKVYVEGFGEATAADTGGAIKGNRIDVFIPSEEDAKDFGVKELKVTIIE